MSKIILSALLCVLFVVLIEANAPEPFLLRLGFTAVDLKNLQKGETIVRTPKTSEVREVAVFAMARLDVPSEFFEASVRDIVAFKKSENVLQIGRFSKPPKAEDLSQLELEPGDIEAIRRCRVRSCELKLPANFINWFHSQIDWSAPNYRQRVNELARQMLLSQVRDYLQSGNDSLGKYDDKPYALHRSEEFRYLLEPAPYVYEPVADFQKYLQDFPQSRPSEVEDILYWSKEKFGGKAVISLTHLMIYKHAKPGGTDILIASKGIYASHYIEASLGLTTFISRNKQTGAGPYLIYINRSRVDALRGLLAGLKRSLIIGSVRDGAKKNMQLLKARLEAQYQLTSR